MIEPNHIQLAAIEADNSSLMVGPAGTGKSLALQHRLLRLLRSGYPENTTLILIADSGHASFYRSILLDQPIPHTGLFLGTFPRWVKESVSLFWPLVSEAAGFSNPEDLPTFLSYDLAQLAMWKNIAPMIDVGAFTGLPLRSQQIVSQLLDTLNRAALNGISLSQAHERQLHGLAGQKERLRYMEDAKEAIDSFRRVCLDNNLLDLSLLIQVFTHQLLDSSEYVDYLQTRFNNLIVDNLEEQTPVGHDFIHGMMKVMSSSALAVDIGGGYKRFMAADPVGAIGFRSHCEHVFEMNDSFVATKSLIHLSNLVNNRLQGESEPTDLAGKAVKSVIIGRYRREMVTRCVQYISALIDEEDLQPRDIAFLTPYLDNALRHTISQSMNQHDLPYYFARRRSAPRDEPRVRSWLTLLAIAHPKWGIRPGQYDVAEALNSTIYDLDPARAQLVVDNLYQVSDGELRSVDNLTVRMKERIGLQLIDAVEVLRLWLSRHGRDQLPLDTFLFRLYEELLSTERFQPEPDFEAATVCDWLVRSAGRFRLAARKMGFDSLEQQGIAFIEGINSGMVAANPPQIGNPPDLSGILVSTIHSFLLSGRSSLAGMCCLRLVGYPTTATQQCICPCQGLGSHARMDDDP